MERDAISVRKLKEGRNKSKSAGLRHFTEQRRKNSFGAPSKVREADQNIDCIILHIAMSSASVVRTLRKTVSSNGTSYTECYYSKEYFR